MDESAAIISYEEYYPYGSTSYQSVREQVEISPKRYRYTGKERDEETGLYYHGARYCIPWLGRWSSCDPAGLVDGSNLYAYVKDNPVILHDPSGHEGSIFDTFKPGGTVFEAVDSFVNPNRNEHPALAAVMDNLNNRGKDIVEGVTTTLKETGEDYADIAYYTIHNDEPGAAQKVGAALERRATAPVKQAEGMVKGFGQMLKRVGEGAGDVAYYAGHSDEPGADAKIANAVTDIVLDAPQIVLTVESGAGALRSAAGALAKGEVAASMAPKGVPAAAPPPPPPTSTLASAAAGPRRLPIVNPHFDPIVTPAEAFQGATESVANKLMANPPAIARHLEPWRIKLAEKGLRGQQMVFGNAVERALAEATEGNGLLEHTGDVRPLVKGGPDFVGQGPYSGLKFQVTTRLQYLRNHLVDSAPGTLFGLYDSPTRPF